MVEAERSMSPGSTEWTMPLYFTIVKYNFDRGLRVLEDLLTDLGQAKSARRPIQQPHAESFFQQGDAAADARFGYAKHAGGRRESPIDDNGDKELEIVKITHRLPPFLSSKRTLPHG
jgi:hypothetical protein